MRALIRAYGSFDGRTTRRQLWTFALGVLLSLILWGALLLRFGSMMSELFFFALMAYPLTLITPLLARVVRRLNDVCSSGDPAWVIRAQWVPVVGVGVLVWRLTKPGETGANAHGPDPRLDCDAPSVF